MSNVIKKDLDHLQEHQAAGKPVEYIYVVHGVIPELMAVVAYCRRGRSELYQRKVIRCPYCPDGTLTDVDIHTQVKIYRNPNKKKLQCQQYLKCKKCKREVGIVLKVS